MSVSIDHLEVGKKYLVRIYDKEDSPLLECKMLDVNPQGLHYIELPNGKKTVIKTTDIIEEIKE